MNSKGHLIFSLVKSALRLVGCIIVFIFSWSDFNLSLGLIGFSLCFAAAEVLGIFEELVDER